MSPFQILLMRHAEKGADLADPDLSEEGKARARQLVAYIPATFGQLDFLFATAQSNHSVRPIGTIKPLSETIGVPIDASYSDQDYGALAQELLSNAEYIGKKILVCWHHGNIPSFAQALRGTPGSYPDPWDPSVFNEILQFVYGPGDVPTVRQVLEPF
jgi:broad specificity phosphatase PhoE